ncbi:hypothetical protein Tsubulata_038500 [Turnera subulata]|uniref:Uncharacterized protein n=1 Tax=Turnera subulata TaxID=218843 RepID=A0A9Q0JBB6_9ROSI|nr:hypothetical protein Tsubulata_038500 [Turnera subulata]
MGRGVFVKGLMTSYVVSDELEVIPASTDAAFQLALYKPQLIDGSSVTERIFDVGVSEQMLEMLRFSLVSKTALTQTLLHHNTLPESSRSRVDSGQGRRSINIKHDQQQNNHESSSSQGDQYEKICVRLCDKQIEAGGMLCGSGFLTVPLGYILKEEMGSAAAGGVDGGSQSQEGCIRTLYKSVDDLYAADTILSDELKDVLLCPKIPMRFGYTKQLLGLEEVEHNYSYQRYNYDGQITLTTRTGISSKAFELIDPKSSSRGKTEGGFLKGPAMFTVTDNLNITHFSLVYSLSLLKSLNVPLTDVEKVTVYIGKEEV